MAQRKVEEFKLTLISQQEALSKGAIRPQLLSPKFEAQRFRYMCGNCGQELSRNTEPIPVGTIFECTNCKSYSRLEG